MSVSLSSSKNLAFLNISSSVLGKRWVLRFHDDRLALTLSQRMELPEIVGRILAARGIGLDEVKSFLNPTLREELPNPTIFRDMDIAVIRIAKAVKKNEKIVIFGDYDVDGATSSAVLKRYLLAIDANVDVYIPDRLKEGYGPNASALSEIQSNGASLVVTVDCGTTAFDALEAAHNQNLDVIVIDHHDSEEALPKALAIVNPKRLDGGNNDFKHLAAVGLSFLCVVALNRHLRERGWFLKRKEPDLLHLLDLVALGTVCDVVPLVGINRAFVHQGLKIMAFRKNAGLSALADIAGIDEAPGPYHAGFIFGPRVNAGGRVGESHLGSRLLSTNDTTEAIKIAEKLEIYNRERQDLEATILEEAMEQINMEGDQTNAMTIVSGVGWHPGVIGIVASRLKDKFNKPSCVITFDGTDGNSMGTGSGRSSTGIDLGQAVIAAKQSNIIVKGGGHAMAAGFSLSQNNLQKFKSFMQKRIGTQIKAHAIEPILSIDGLIQASGATIELLEVLAQIGPFGAGNPEPRFVLSDARLTFSSAVGLNHVRCRIEDASGGTLNGIAFRCIDTPLGELLLNHVGANFHFAGKLRINNWQGRSSSQIIIDDAATLY